jgi:hypothetical protein
VVRRLLTSRAIRLRRRADRSRAERARSAALLALLVCVAAGLTAASYLVAPSTARSFTLLYGSVFLNDNTEPVAVDIASGRPTVRLANASRSVSASASADLRLFRLAANRTLMLNTRTGEFNMIDATGYVLKPTGGGVRLPEPGPAQAVPAGPDSYLLRNSGSDASVYLVSPNTVAGATGPHARPRAFGTLSHPLAERVTGAAAVAIGRNLEALEDLGAAGSAATTRRYGLVELAVPPGSNAGARLRQHTVTRFSATGPVALESAAGATGEESAPRPVVAVAKTDSVIVLSATGKRTVSVGGVGAVDQILPVSDLDDRPAFLFHDPAGWMLVRLPAAASETSADVLRLPGIDPAAQLIAPAASNGAFYSMDATGRLWQIGLQAGPGGARPVPGAGNYPVLPKEPSGFAGAAVMGIGNRVIYNVPGRYRAEVLFTDGSSPPVAIDKHAGVRVDPNGSPALPGISGGGHKSRAPAKGPHRPHRHTVRHPKPPAPRPVHQPEPAAPVTDKINCRTTSQIPHVPTLELVERGSRSVRLHWDYTRLDPQDCLPSTYVVSVHLISGSAPPAPASVTVENQEGVELVGLFPDTEYSLTVTAYINGRGTASQPLLVRTSVEGPAAPTGVSTTVDASGNWMLRWNSCGGVRQGCVPVASWQIVPRYCDGRGLAAPPEPRTLVGDPTQHAFTFTYTGGEALLGRGLSFTVEGIGEKQTVGKPAGDGSCSYSWAHPVPSDIDVQASAPAQTASSTTTTTTTVSVGFKAGAVSDLGGVGGTLTYRLVSGGSPVATEGPTSDTTVTLSGILPGKRYQVIVTATPPRHPEAAVALPAVDVRPAIAAWPAPTVTASFHNTSATTGRLTVIPSLGAADVRGETFDLVNSSLVCGSTYFSLDGSDIRPAQRLIFPFDQPGTDRFTYHGTCSVTVQLQQNARSATDPPLYGAGPSAKASDPVTIAPPASTARRDDFSASWVANTPVGSPAVVVSYSGRDPLSVSAGWRLTVDNGTGRTCGSATAQPTVTIAVDPDCVRAATTWTLSLSYSYFADTPSFTLPVAGDRPTPVDPARITFDDATWAGTADAPTVVVHYTGEYGPGMLATLKWTATVTSNGVTCGTSSDVPAANGPEIAVDTSLCPPTSEDSDGQTVQNSYSLTISYKDPNYGGSQDYAPPIDGDPPQQ